MTIILRNGNSKKTEYLRKERNLQESQLSEGKKFQESQKFKKNLNFKNVNYLKKWIL